jgi:hypothetical protein
VEKKKKAWQQWISMAVFLVIGGVCGIFIGLYMHAVELYLIIIGIWLAWCIQIVIHEAGHLVFGLISGYRFISFQVMGFMWVRENGKVKFKRLSHGGTGGQCLMSPPAMVDGKFPFVLYNLGGSIMNTVAAAVFFALYVFCGDNPVLSVFFLILSAVGAACAIANGVPLRLSTLDNDGYNTLSLMKHKEALRSLWIQLKVSEQVANGVRPKDMPAEWFVVPSDEEMHNSMVAVVGVFACNRLMDEQDFQKANALMKHLLAMDSGMVGLHRHLLICDRIFCELLEGNTEEATKLLTREQKKFMKALKKFPCVLRTEYAYALFVEKDGKKAINCEESFEKIAKTYPYPGDLQAERELMELVKNNAMTLYCN